MLTSDHGGDERKPAGPKEPLVYGFFSIDAYEQNLVLIHFRYPTPVCAEPIERFQLLHLQPSSWSWKSPR